MGYNRGKHQSGDTIIEVLIAIAVIGSVLGITYSIMNRNLLIMRSNQERTEAAKLAQGQIESLKAAYARNPESIPVVGDGGFCMAGNSVILLGAGAPTADAASEDFSDYYTVSGTGDETDPCYHKGLYHIGIIKESPDANNKYKVYVRWERLGGGSLQDGREETVMVYGF